MEVGKHLESLMRMFCSNGLGLGRIGGWHRFHGMWYANQSTKKARSTNITNYELDIIDKVGGQDYEFCGRIGFESLMRLLWHVTGLGDFHGLYSRSTCIMEWLEAYFSRVGEYFVAKLGNDIKLCYWLDDS